MNPVVSILRRIAYRAWRHSIRAELDHPHAYRMFDLDLVITPGVLHPRHFASSRILAEYLLTEDLKGLEVADVGTGSGILGLVAARAGAEVTATDINSAAVRCARENVARNGLNERMRVTEADILGPGEPEIAFDLIVTNPPFYPRSPATVVDFAFESGEGHAFFARLASALPGRLAAGGRLVLIHSSDTDFAPIQRVLGNAGFTGRAICEHRGFFETLTLRQFQFR